MTNRNNAEHAGKMYKHPNHSWRSSPLVHHVSFFENQTGVLRDRFDPDHLRQFQCNAISVTLTGYAFFEKQANLELTHLLSEMFEKHELIFIV